ncbi:MAG: hypothetical protein MJ171_04625 [Clostridia bacterium]|nr:hypothetical protein [Clostridia bacterium]
MKSIAVLSAYFGKLPGYFPLWLKTCKYNPDIDFIIFTDDETSFDFPENVKRVHLTLKEMKKRAEDALGFEVSLERPYKCCDFKPTYGEIFLEYIREYSYFGYCDLDMMFGDITGFLKKYEYEKYDRFLVLGHLALYRNTEYIRNSFKLDSSLGEYYRKVFTTDRNYGFDEISGMYRICRENEVSMFDGRIFADISNVYKRFRFPEKRHTPLNPDIVTYRNEVYTWEKGKVFRYYEDSDRKIKREEYIYIHYQKRPDFEYFFNPADTDSFYITNSGFYKKDEEVTLDDIKKYNRYPGKLVEDCETLKRFIKQKKRYLKEHIDNILGK